MLNKPKIGHPCNGCGLCCKLMVCASGAFVQGLVEKYGDTIPGPCPALKSKADGSYSCGIVDNPKKYFPNNKYQEKVLSENFAIAIGAGIGCDELIENDTQEEVDRLNLIIGDLFENPDLYEKINTAMVVLYGFSIK